MEKQLEAYLHEESKLWSFIIRFQKQIMNARKDSKERNLTWWIQEDSNCWTHSEHFLESISCILYVVLKLGKLEIQHFKWCMNQSWNEEVRAIGSQSHKAKGQFRRLRNQPLAAKSQEDGCEISLWLRNGVLHVVKFCSHLARLRNSSEASQYLRPTLLDFFFRYLLFKSPFSPYNPPIIGFLI